MAPVQKVDRLLARRNLHGLGQALRDRNTLVRRRAAQALGELGDARGVPLLAGAIRKDGDQYVQQWSIDSLRAIGDPAALDALTAIMFGNERRLAALAGRALAELDHEQAQNAVQVRDAVTRNDFAALEQMGERAAAALSILLGSEQYVTWPSAKRKHVLNLAIRLGATPPTQRRTELAGLGLFVSGVHTIGDLLGGLRHRNPAVRIAAAVKLAASGIRWTARPLYRRFKREAGSGGDRSVAVQMARAMAQLGDLRAVEDYRARLANPDGRLAAEAARAMVETGVESALEALFWFVATPPPPPANRNVPVALSALEGAGPPAVDALKELCADERPRVRRLLVEVIARCGHSEAADLLAHLGQDANAEVQHAALDGLAELNTAEAVDALLGLQDTAPRPWVIRSLAMVTHPRGPEAVRALDPTVTTIRGIAVEGRAPLVGARVQIVQEHWAGNYTGPSVQAISARAETDVEGAFALTIYHLDKGSRPRLKITTAVQRHWKGGEMFVADLRAIAGAANTVRVVVDRVYGRLVVELESVEST